MHCHVQKMPITDALLALIYALPVRLYRCQDVKLVAAVLDNLPGIRELLPPQVLPGQPRDAASMVETFWTDRLALERIKDLDEAPTRESLQAKLLCVGQYWTVHEVGTYAALFGLEVHVYSPYHERPLVIKPLADYPQGVLHPDSKLSNDVRSALLCGALFSWPSSRLPPMRLAHSGCEPTHWKIICDAPQGRHGSDDRADGDTKWLPHARITVSSFGNAPVSFLDHQELRHPAFWNELQSRHGWSFGLCAAIYFDKHQRPGSEEEVADLACQRFDKVKTCAVQS